LAKLRGGPAGGLHVQDTRDVIYVAYRLNCYGKPVPMTTNDGAARTLPHGVEPDTEALVNHAAGRWACYRKVGADTPHIDVAPGEQLPYPPEGESAFHWICPRRR
jgi:hypothetical protein